MIPLVALINLGEEDSPKRFADMSGADSWFECVVEWLCAPIDFPGKWPTHKSLPTTYNNEGENLPQQPDDRL